MKKYLIVLLLLLFAGALLADDDVSPTNPKYLEWLMSGGLPLKTASGEYLYTGHIPPEFASWTLPEDDGLKRGSFPSSYDLRDEGRVPPVRNQNPYGVCWAFAGVGCMEGSYLTKYPYSSIEYSVFNVVRFCNGIRGKTLNSGGNYLCSAAYYSMLQGPVYEKEDPYNYNLDKDSVPPAPAKTPYIRGYIAEAEFVPANVGWGDSEIWDGSSMNTAAMNRIKQLIMDSGAVEFAYYSNESSYLRTTANHGTNYYCNIEKGTNHEITIIGWDDNYSKSNFRYTPPGDGAWLARNSWGTDFGDDGYFWMSYYDKSAEQYAKFTMTDDTTIYNRYYYKEKKGLTNALKNNIWGTAIFHPTIEGTLVDAATYVLAGGRTVTCYVGINDEWKKSVSKTCEYPGYYLFRVNTEYAAGDKVEVRFKYDSQAADGVFYVPLCNDVSYCSSGSYASLDGSTWKDTLSDYSVPYAVCIKMYCKNPVAATGVSLNASAITLRTGKTRALTATVKPAGATNKKVTWSSSNTSVATVSSSGVVTGKAAGSCVVTVKTDDGGYTATCKVTVEQSVTGVYLNYGSVVMYPGKTSTLVATVKPSNAANKSLVWSSSNTAVATVSPAGVVTGQGAGKCTVTVKTVDGGYTDTCSVTVINPVVAVTGVELDTDFIKLEKGSSATLKATVKPSNATDKAVTWRSDDKSIATVSSSGVVTAVGPGTTKVRVKTKDGSFEAKCKIRVVISVTGVSLNKTSVKLKPGGSVSLKATVSPSDATNKEVTWMSYDTSVATVDANGNVKAVGIGETRIRVKTRDGGFKAKCKVKVAIPVTGITLDKTTVTVNKGSSVTLKATVSPSNATDKTVTWISYDTSIATVDANGKVTGVKPGKVDIRAKTKDGDFTAKCKVTVK